VISSANGTRIDRAELAALRRACPGATVSSIYGHVAESFSVTPLLGIAATLLAGRLPALRGGSIDPTTGLTPATGAETPESVVALCSDYTGHVSALRVGLATSQNL
jgi:hypothetical protein